ncbi:Fe-S cluster assembly protein SufD [Microbacterium lushaniae]|uniref:Fe-S cluster assembly protein SufD n=1 Tax=Microbacterium lushaniae TaxID=2614639 RepID=A0A5J6L3K4_9MICO|nr:Fe-S cluster assembly protein SufD [Microbacterium lushaniae]QEW02956.1 Fe-S cluster assembly protein SufD [Microbacterium lushaniae]
MTTTTTPLPGSRAHTDGGWGRADAPAAPIQTRSERPWSFDPAHFGAPTGREVNWKHTPIDRLGGVLTPGEASSAVRVDTGAAAGYVVSGADVRGEFFRPEDLPAAIAWQRDGAGLHVRIPAGEELTDPLRIDLVGERADGFGAAHIVLEAQPNSRATVILYHSGSAQYAQNVEILVRDGAALTVIAVQRWDDDAVHAATHQARVDRDAKLTHVVVTLGGAVVRVNPSVELSGPGAEGRLFGLSFADAGQHFESQVYLHHKGPHTVGDVLYKGALQGVGARSVWIGDVLIGRDAVGTDSYEANRNLVLTDGARADSIPNLEIETGEIVGAGHASATGRFDDEQLFYLQARGIDEEEARRLVVLGFLSEIVQRIGVPDLETELTAAIERELLEGAAL